MSRPRIIPLLLVKNGIVVRSQRFHLHQDIGNPISTAERFSNWNVDELVILDISQTDWHDLRRDDLQQRYGGNSFLDVLRQLNPVCNMPLTVGGLVRDIGDIEARLSLGADKVTLNTAAIDNPALVDDAAKRFGAQCIVVSIDALRHPDGRLEVHVDGGQRASGKLAATWAKQMEDRGAGEILLNSIDRDGSKTGYDLDLIRSVTSAVGIPVIACGGVGKYEDFSSAILDAGAAAAAAANIFHFQELSYPHAKQAAVDAGVDCRPVSWENKWFPREPMYDFEQRDARIARRLAQSKATLPENTPPPDSIQWCTKCCYPTMSATPMEFDEHGVCSGCKQAEVKVKITDANWTHRRDAFAEILDRHRCRDGSRHDCIIPVSGGKDSWYQVHIVRNELGLNPLLVTYDANNWTPAGWRNMLRMKEIFDCDHVVVSPSVPVLKKLNRLGFIIMGDMNWHAHVGIMTAPVRVALHHKIPLIVWGEHGYLDVCGQYAMDDFPEMSFRDRLEHPARGYEWNYFVGLEGLTERDLITWKYPTDREIFEHGIRGIFSGNYLPWEANRHGPMMIEKYGFEISDEPFERTYRRMSNLDDMHENGIHDYLKYVKFGYGRGTDHVSKDIRAGILSRAQGLDLIRRHDPVKSRDLQRWLDYANMTEDEFDRIADTFRDPRIWWRKDGKWRRHKLNDTNAPPVSAQTIN
jgi:imidazoleglycerol phosphate synthase cyclase subunit